MRANEMSGSASSDASNGMPKRHSTLGPIVSWIGVVFFALATGVLGTLLHRSGADRSIPWGMVLAFLLVFASGCWARHAHGFTGVAVNLLVCSTLIWMVSSSYGPGGDILVPISSAAFVTFWSKNAGYAWLLGSVLFQLLPLALPKKWFVRGGSAGSAARSSQR